VRRRRRRPQHARESNGRFVHGREVSCIDVSARPARDARACRRKTRVALASQSKGAAMSKTVDRVSLTLVFLAGYGRVAGVCRRDLTAGLAENETRASELIWDALDKSLVFSYLRRVISFVTAVCRDDTA
jgi:hypothetical protein